MPITKVNTFQAFLDELRGVERVLVKFEADWCMPCKAMTSVVEEISNQYPEVKVIAVDIDGDGMEEVLIQYKVRTIPTFVHLKDGSTVRTACGTISKAELSALLQGE